MSKVRYLKRKKDDRGGIYKVPKDQKAFGMDYSVCCDTA